MQWEWEWELGEPRKAKLSSFWAAVVSGFLGYCASVSLTEDRCSSAAGLQGEWRNEDWIGGISLMYNVWVITRKQRRKGKKERRMCGDVERLERTFLKVTQPAITVHLRAGPRHSVSYIVGIIVTQRSLSPYIQHTSLGGL